MKNGRPDRAAVLFARLGNRSGVVAVAATTNVIGIEIHVVATLVIIVRRRIEQSRARIVAGAIRRSADVVDSGVACQSAPGLISPGSLTRSGAAQRARIAEAVMASSHHRTDAAKQQRAADHSRGRCGCRS